MNNNIISLKKGSKTCYFFGIFILILVLIIYFIASVEGLSTNGTISLLFFAFIGLLIVSFRTAVEINHYRIRTSYHLFNILIKSKEDNISKYNTIFLEKKSYSNLESSHINRYYEVTLANDEYYNLRTWVITPLIYKHIYSLNKIAMFNVQTKGNYEKAQELATEIKNVTRLHFVCESE